MNYIYPSNKPLVAKTGTVKKKTKKSSKKVNVDLGGFPFIKKSITFTFEN